MKTKIVIITLALLSLFLISCGSKESESEVPAIENEKAVQEESITEESTIETSESETMTEESYIEELITEESAIETSESDPMTEELTYTISGLDKKMYVSKECNTYTEPYDTSVIFSGFNQGDLVQLIGEVVFTDNQDNNGVWYKFNIDGDEGYINAEYLTTENPNAQPEVFQQQPTQPEQTQPEQTQPQPEQTTPTQPTETTPQQTQPDTNIYDDSEVVINPETGQPAQSGDTWRDGNGFIVEYWENDEDLAQYGWY